LYAHPNVVNVFQKLRELWQHFEKGFDHDNAEFLPFIVSPKGFKYELESNILENSI